MSMGSPFADLSLDVAKLLERGYLSPFRMEKVDGDGGQGMFCADEPKTGGPTLYFPFVEPNAVRCGVIHRISYRLNPTNAVTYTLMLWDGRTDTSVNVYDINAHLLYESPALQADDTDYDVPNQHIAFVLKRDNRSSGGLPYKLYYSIDWTGDPGSYTTPGYIKIEGVGVYI